MGRKLFISDTHFFHDNVIGFDERPWNTLEEMHSAMLEMWNEKVDKGDDVYILGDYSWRVHDEAIEFLSKLKGNKHLIYGNHDPRNAGNKFTNLFASMKDYNVVTVILENGTKRKCVLSHYFIPLYDGHYRGDILLHGHSHTTKEHDIELSIAEHLNDMLIPVQAYNVGACLPYINYVPRTLDEIIKGGDKYIKEYKGE